MGHNEGMSTPETVTSTPPLETVVVPEQRGRALASAVAVFLGGYLVLSALGGQLVNALAGFSGAGPELAVLFVLQLVFALAVVIGGYFLAPASAGRKLVASAIVVLGVILVIALMITRLTGSLGPIGGIPTMITLANPAFMTVLLVGAGWLIVRSARLGWLTLLAAAVLIPIQLIMNLNGIGFAITQIVVLFFALVVGAAVIAAGRPARG